MLSGSLTKGRWAVLGMVTEGGDSSSVITFLQKSQIANIGALQPSTGKNSIFFILKVQFPKNVPKTLNHVK